MDTITLPRTLATAILQHAQQSPDNEVCGLVGSKNGQALRLYPVQNVAPDQARHYTMDPKSQIDAMRQMRENDETLFAIYHSHPDTEATPSAEDLAQASYLDAVYLIVSLNTEGVLVMRGFHLRDGEVRETPLAVE